MFLIIWKDFIATEKEGLSAASLITFIDLSLPLLQQGKLLTMQ